MAKEKDNELQDIELDALEAAKKYMENCRNHLRDVMKPAEKAAKELENDTATEKVRLQGTKETKAPNLKPYTESIPAKNRLEIGKLINAAKAEGRPWKIGRCNEELEAQGYRYTFYTTTKEDAVAFKENINYNKKERLTLSEDVDLVPAEEPEEEPTTIDLGGEEEPAAEEPVEITPMDVFTKYFGFSGDDETGVVSICLKEKPEDEEECACITVALTPEEFEVMQPMFTAEQGPEPEGVPADEINPEEAEPIEAPEEPEEEKQEGEEELEEGAGIGAALAVGSVVNNLVQNKKMMDDGAKKHKHGPANPEETMKLHNDRMEKNPNIRKFDSAATSKLKLAKQLLDKDPEDEFAKEIINDTDEELRIDESAHISLDDLKLFKPWGGAKDVWELILSQDKLEALDKALEDMYPDGLKASELNELLWFETDWVIDTLGIDPTAAAKAPEEDIIDGEAEVIDVEPEGDSNEEK